MSYNEIFFNNRNKIFIEKCYYYFTYHSYIIISFWSMFEIRIILLTSRRVSNYSNRKIIENDNYCITFTDLNLLHAFKVYDYVSKVFKHFGTLSKFMCR